MKQLIDLTAKKILVVGASSGIGRETALLLSDLGANLVLIARREEMLRELIGQMEGENRYYAIDFSRTIEVENILKVIVSDCGAFDGAVYCAGIGSTRPLRMMKPEFIREVMDINFFSFVEMVRCLTKPDAFNEGFSIVGISSIAALQGNRTKTAYSASKAAMNASVRCMANELAPKKIRLNTVMPAWVKTDMYDSYLNKTVDSEDAKMVLARQYMGVAECLDIANIIAYLLSDAAKFITGSSIAIDGGRLSS